ncbi:amidase [Prosthecodimorpha staleyi]|uniref:Indoleacetamide hydrolase n=1 Tax=Prosthecodimorpha staleyi TaxID=2840188 RepID=A0A947D3S8_9HYPH|nr:amidase [Prosthecodimorpha staleyi]MBT9289719.1 amidase [Prosthecodimorpha staleyi]
MTDLCFLTIAEASRLIAARKLSPVELTRAFLERIERYDAGLNAYILVTADKAMADARTAEAEIMAGRWRGPLHGIPIALKDIYNTAGIATTAHSALFKDHVPAEDAVTTRLLAEAGTVLLGKTATWEFAIGGTSFDLPWPPARNPWNPKHDPGGSSSGTGAAVAAGLAMAGMGTDTGGSIRFPAAWCGLAGLKPTYGLVSRRGILPLSFSLDHGGPMCWTSEDCALMMQALAAHDPLDPGSADVPIPDFAAALSPSLKGLRIGVPRHFWETDVDCGAETKAAIEAALEVYRGLGAEIVEVTLSPLGTYNDTGTLISRSEAYAIHEQYLTKTPELYGAIARQRISMGALVRAPDYVNALRLRGELIRELAAVMTTVDVIVTPTTPDPAPLLGEVAAFMSKRKSLFSRAFNVTGSPALSTPSGFSSDGLPLSMQIVGRPFQDDLVLKVGHAYEKATAWRDRRPVLAEPYAAAAQ